MESATALRVRELPQRGEAVLLRFPAARAHARARRARLIAARRRLVLVAVALAVALVVVLGGGPGGTAVASRPGAPSAITVAPGGSLWEIAEWYAPSNVDPRAYVDALQEINDLRGPLRAGERIRLPD